VRRRWTASTLRLSVTVEALCPPALSSFSAPAGVLLVYPAFGRVPRRWTASTLRPSASSLDSEHPSPECHRRSSLPSGSFLFFPPPLGSYWYIQPSAECLVAGQRAPFARVRRRWTASTLRLSVTVEALCPPTFFFFFRPRWGPDWYIQPSAECLVAGQRAPFARVRRRWTASTLRLSVSCWNSEHPSPECHRRSSLPSYLSFFPPPLGSYLVYPAFGRVPRRWTASTSNT
jgi:hypothetical protein